MKTIEELKAEQSELKNKLHEVIEFTNSEEYFELSPREKSLIGQQRAGMEMYLNALTNRIYSKDEYSFDATSAMGMVLLSNIMNSSPFGGSYSKVTEELKNTEEAEIKESNFEIKKDSHE